MPLGGWVVQSIIEFQSNGVSVMERIAASTNVAAIRQGELTGQLTTQEAAWLRLQGQMERTSAKRAETVTALSAGVAVAGAVTLGYAIDQAANFERAMLNLQIATHASKSQMDAFRDSVYSTAAATAQSAPSIAALFGDVASTSAIPAKYMTPAFLSEATKFGEIVQMKSKGTTHEFSAVEAAKDLIELAHQYRAYSASQLTQFAEILHQATYFMPAGLTSFVTQSKYFAPVMALSSGNMDAMRQGVELGVFLQQTGLGRGRGATGIAAFERAMMQGLEQTSFATGRKKAALEAMGIIDPKTGYTPFIHHNSLGQEFTDQVGAMGQVMKYFDQHTVGLTGGAKDRAQQEVMKTILTGLGVQGSLIAMVAAGGGYNLIHSNDQRMRQIPTVDQDQAARLKLYFGELQRSTSGVATMFSTLGKAVLPEATSALRHFADGAEALNFGLEHNEGAAKGLMFFVTYLTASTTLRVVAALGSRFVSLIGGVDGATGSVAGLNVALKILNPELAAFTAAVSFLAGLKFDWDFVRSHPGSSMFGTNYGYPGQEVIQAGGYASAPRLPRMSSPQHELMTKLNAPGVTIHGQTINVYTNNAKQFADDLLNPQSPLYGGTKTMSRVPQALSVPPR